jgi:hypothetical protein
MLVLFWDLNYDSIYSKLVTGYITEVCPFYHAVLVLIDRKCKSIH